MTFKNIYNQNNYIVELNHFKERAMDYFNPSVTKPIHDGENALFLTCQGVTLYTLSAELLELTDSSIHLKFKCTCPYFREVACCKHVFVLSKQLMFSTLGQQLAEQYVGQTIYVNGSIDHSESYDDFDDDEYDDEYYDTDEYNQFGASRNSSHPSWEKSLLSLRVQPQPIIDRQALIASTFKNKKLTAPKNIQLCIAYKAGFRVMMSVYKREQLKSGKWSKEKKIKLISKNIMGVASSKQRDLLLYLSSFNSYYSRDHEIEVANDSIASVLERIAGTENTTLYFQDEFYHHHFSLPFDFDKTKSCQVKLKITPCRDSGEFAIESVFVNHVGVPLSLEENSVVFNDEVGTLIGEQYFICRNQQILNQLEVSGILDVRIPQASIESFMQRLITKVGVDNIYITPDLPVEIVTVDFQAEMHINSSLSSLGTSVDNGIMFEAIVFWEEIEKHSEQITVFDHQKKMEYIASLTKLDLPVDYENVDGEELILTAIPGGKFLEVLNTLEKCGWKIFIQKQRVKAPSKMSMGVASGIDWFEVKSEIAYSGEEVEIPKILKAAKKNNRYFSLADGSVALLPQQWLKKQIMLYQMGEPDGDIIKLDQSSVFILDQILDERQKELPHFLKLKKQIEQRFVLKSICADKKFQGELRSYQQIGLSWLVSLANINQGGLLADEMGLGKTIQVLAMLQKLKRQQKLPNLLIVPKSLLYNWQKEKTVFTPELNFVEYSGKNRKALLDNLSAGMTLIMTYAILQRDILTLKDIKWDFVILDEAQNIKNEKSKNAKSVFTLQANYRFALTGTPIENHLGELFSIFRFLNPTMFGNRFHIGDLIDDGEMQQVILQGLRPFILRRTKLEVLPDLPPKIEQILYCPMKDEQQKQYDDMKKYYRQSLKKQVDREGMGKSKMHILEALLRLRQIACHPALLDKTLSNIEAGKMELLLEHLDELKETGNKALVFSQFTSHLKLIGERLRAKNIKYAYLDGKTTNREAVVQDFKNSADISVFLISMKAGGVGLNLTEASYCFLMDPWWNPAVESQAIDRMHRIGQQNPVMAYKLISQGTIEEKIIELQKKKRGIFDKLETSSNSVLKDLNKEELFSFFQ